MTVYWWNHWFWITFVIANGLLLEAYPLGPSLDTNTKEYNHNSNNNRKDSKNPIEFPLDDVTDIEDVFNGRDSIPNQKELNVSQKIHLNFNETGIDRRNNYSNNSKDSVDRDRSAANDSVIKLLSPENLLNDSLNEKDIDSSITKNNSNIISTKISSTNITKLTNTSPPRVLDSAKLATENVNTSTELSKSVISTSLKPRVLAGINDRHSNEDNPQNNTSSEIEEIDGLIQHKAPFTLENVNREEELVRAESEHRTRKSKVLSAEYRHHENNHINFSSDSKNLLARSTSLDFDEQDEGNVSSEALSVQRAYFIDAGTISGICFAVLAVCCAVAFVGVIVYRRRYLNKPQTLSEPDSSVYIDDSTIRTIFILQDNSDEMYSLDNDSFLNSLEAMTIQNYWTDTVKHTKL